MAETFDPTVPPPWTGMQNAPQAALDMTTPPSTGPLLPPGTQELTQGYLPTWGEVPLEALRNLAPQAVDIAGSMPALASAAMSPVQTGMRLGEAATNRYGAGGGFAKLMDDFDTIATQFKHRYTTQAGLKQYIAKEPVWAALDAASFMPGSVLGREAMQAARTGERGLLAMPDLSLMPKVRQADPEVLARIIAEQEDQAARNVGNGMGGTWVNASEPDMLLRRPGGEKLKEPSPAQLEDMGFISLPERVAMEQDAGFGARGAGDTAASIDPKKPWNFANLREPGANTLEKDFGLLNMRGTPTAETATGNMGNETLRARARALLDERFPSGQPAAQGPGPTPLGRGEKAWLDNEIERVQGAMRTPDGTADPWSGGWLENRRTSNPSEDSWPFRQTRLPDEHPRDIGIDPPGQKPGTWVQSGGGKRWDWRSENTPGTPGSDTIENQAGYSAVGHKGHWTAGEVGSGAPQEDRFWQWVLDTNNTRKSPGAATRQKALDDIASNEARQARINLARNEPLLPGIKAAPDWAKPVDLQAVPTDEVFDRQRGMVRALLGHNPDKDLVRRLLVQQEDARRNAALITHDPNGTGFIQRPLPVPDARFHPAAGQLGAQALRGPAPTPGQFARKPDGLLAANDATPNPFDPQGDRFKPTPGQLRAKTLPEPDTGQMNMFGLKAMTSPWDAQSRAIFKAEAPLVDWPSHPSVEINHGNVNSTSKISYEGREYFRKINDYDPTRQRMDTGSEVSALEIGDLLGASVLPVVRTGKDELVTPFINGANFHKTHPNKIEGAIRNMTQEQRDRQVMWEFLMADNDKHGGNYYVALGENGAPDRVTGIDYGDSLNGTERTMFGVNAMYRGVKDQFGADKISYSKDVMRDILTKEEAAFERLKANGVTHQGKLTKLRDRFNIIRKYLERVESGTNSGTYTDFEVFATSKDAR